MLAYGIGLGWLGRECQNYLLRQPAWAEGSGRGTLLWDRDRESPSCTQHLLPHPLEAAVGGVVAKGKVWEGSERDDGSGPGGTMQDPGSPELLLCHSPAASKEPFGCPGASALSPDPEGWAGFTPSTWRLLPC